MMNYKDFKPEDFIQDELFNSWIIDKDEAAAQYWNEFLKKNPEKRNGIEQAKTMLPLLNSVEDKTCDKEVTDEKISTTWKKISFSQNSSHGKSHSENRLFLDLRKIAAIFIIFLGIASIIYLFFPKNNSKNHLSGINKKEGKEVQLILADGSIVDLHESQQKKIIDADGTLIEKKEDNTIAYKQKNISPITLNYNKIIIPKGKRFNLVLSDGTKVWLNSGSELKYPTLFTSRDRTVYLKGEAYFDVERNENKPFIVQTNHVAIRVLGTTFNISAYEDDPFVETTLVYGEVGLYKSVSDYNPETAIYLKPNYKASYNKDEEHMYLEKVDTRMYTSWKEGILCFKDEKFETLAPKIERWYDIKIYLRDESINNLRFTGTIREDKSLEHVLELIQVTCPIITWTSNGNNIYLNINPEKLNLK